MSIEVIEDMIRASEVSARVETAVLALGKQPGWFFKTVGWDHNRWEQVVDKGQGMVRLPELVRISDALCVPFDYLKNQAHFNGSPKNDDEPLRDAPHLFTDGDKVYGELLARLCEVEPFAGCAKFELDMTPEQLEEIRAGVRPVRIPKFVQLLSRDLITPLGSRLRGAKSDVGEIYHRLLGLLTDVPERLRGELVLTEEDIEVYEVYRNAHQQTSGEEASEDDPEAVADGAPTLDDVTVHAFRSAELGSSIPASRQDCGSGTVMQKQVEDGNLSSSEPSQEDCGEPATDPPDASVDAEDQQASPHDDCPGDGTPSEDEAMSETPVEEELPEEPDYDTPENRKQLAANLRALFERRAEEHPHNANQLGARLRKTRLRTSNQFGYALAQGRSVITPEVLEELGKIFELEPTALLSEELSLESEERPTIPVAPMDRVSSSAEERKALGDAPAEEVQEAPILEKEKEQEVSSVEEEVVQEAPATEDSYVLLDMVVSDRKLAKALRVLRERLATMGNHEQQLLLNYIGRLGR